MEKIAQSLIEKGYYIRKVKLSGQFAESGKIDSFEVTANETGEVNLDEQSEKWALMLGLTNQELDDFDVVCLDLDVVDPKVNKKIGNIVERYYRESELYLRQGNRKKIGMLFFKVDKGSLDREEGVHKDTMDLIIHTKRCDILGLHPSGHEYNWPYNKLWDVYPHELPWLNEQMYKELKDLLWSNEPAKNDGDFKGRNDELTRRLAEYVYQGKTPDEIISHAFDIDSKFDQSWIKEEFDSPNDFIFWLFDDLKRQFKKSDNPGTFFVNHSKLRPEFNLKKDKESIFYKEFAYPKAEKGSLFDLVYKLIEQNLYKESKTLAVSATLAFMSALCSTKFQFEGVIPNLFCTGILTSGDGKSTAISIIRDILQEMKMAGFFLEGFENDQALIKTFEYENRPFLVIDEAQTLFDKSNKFNPSKAKTGVILSRAYGDYSNDQFFPGNKLKDINYGYCFGPRATMLAFSTESFIKNFGSEHLIQGIARRMLFFVDLTYKKYRKNRNACKFKDYEFKNLVMRKIQTLYNPAETVMIDGQDYGVCVYVKDKDNPNKTTIDFARMATKRKMGEVRITEDARRFFENDFIDILNKLSKEVYFKNDYAKYLLQSIGEMVKKLAIIHACTCRKVDIAPTITIDSIEWAFAMFMCYQREAIELFEGEKKAESDEYIVSKLTDVEEYIVERLNDMNIREFTKSTIRTSRADYKANFERAAESLIDKGIIKKIGNKRYEYIGLKER